MKTFKIISNINIIKKINDDIIYKKSKKKIRYKN